MSHRRPVYAPRLALALCATIGMPLVALADTAKKAKDPEPDGAALFYRGPNDGVLTWPSSIALGADERIWYASALERPEDPTWFGWVSADGMREVGPIVDRDLIPRSFYEDSAGNLTILGWDATYQLVIRSKKSNGATLRTRIVLEPGSERLDSFNESRSVGFFADKNGDPTILWLSGDCVRRLTLQTNAVADNAIEATFCAPTKDDGVPFIVSGFTTSGLASSIILFGDSYSGTNTLVPLTRSERYSRSGTISRCSQRKVHTQSDIDHRIRPQLSAAQANLANNPGEDRYARDVALFQGQLQRSLESLARCDVDTQKANDELANGKLVIEGVSRDVWFGVYDGATGELRQEARIGAEGLSGKYEGWDAVTGGDDHSPSVRATVRLWSQKDGTLIFFVMLREHPQDVLQLELAPGNDEFQGVLTREAHPLLGSPRLSITQLGLFQTPEGLRASPLLVWLDPETGVEKSLRPTYVTRPDGTVGKLAQKLSIKSVQTRDGTPYVFALDDSGRAVVLALDPDKFKTGEVR